MRCHRWNSRIFLCLVQFYNQELYTSKSGDIEYEGRAAYSRFMACYFGGENENGRFLYDLVIRQNCAADIHKPICYWNVRIRIPAYFA